MTTFQATVASDERHVLAEGPAWDDSTGQILRVHIVKGQVSAGQLKGDGIRQSRRDDFGGMVGAAVRSGHGDLLVAGLEPLFVVSPSGERTPGPWIVPEGKPSRTNDGACGPAGRLLIGTLPLDDSTGEETLLRAEVNGELASIDSDPSLSNGLAWSPDGRLFYSTDTAGGIICVRDYDPATGAVGERGRHLNNTDGFPDGICTNSWGYLWISIWGAGEIRPFSPEGKHEHTVKAPCPHSSSVAFVPPAGRTSDHQGVTAPHRERSPDVSRRRATLQRPRGHHGRCGSPWSAHGSPGHPTADTSHIYHHLDITGEHLCTS